MPQLKEAISTFDTWVDDKRLNKAVTEWQPKRSSREGQLAILDAAKSGDVAAADYLFLTFTKLIAKVFWVYYLGPNKKYAKGRIMAGEDEDFAAMAYTMLLDKEELSPYKTFNPDVFSGDTDLIKQFGYYFYRYLQRTAVKMIRAAKLSGITGNFKADEMPTTVEYDDTLSDAPAEGASFTDEVDMKETIRAFLDVLKKDNEKHYNIFKSRLKGNSIPQTAKELSLSAQGVRNSLKDIQNKYNAFIGEESREN